MTFLFCLGYGKTVSHVVIGLKTAKGTKQLKLDPSIYESLQKEKVEVGDVIYIEANSGAVKVKTSIVKFCAYWHFWMERTREGIGSLLS